MAEMEGMRAAEMLLRCQMDEPWHATLYPHGIIKHVLFHSRRKSIYTDNGGHSTRTNIVSLLKLATKQKERGQDC